MAYTVLARRYRSATFDEVIGQEPVAQTLKKAIASDRIAHAFLFCGTRGTGKTSMARILAKALNCQKSDTATPEPCGTCDSCLAIARGEDMSVIEIDAASNTGVDDIREVIENAYTRAPGRFKVYIIDEVHMLSKNAFNALLKTLEEPPSHVKFILATTEAEKVLPTILSRCQRYDFRNIRTREIAGHLKQVCKREKVKADDEAILLVARAGAGSMRDALSVLDRLLSVGEKHLTTDMIEQLLGVPKAQVIHSLVGAIAKGDVKQTLEIAGKLLSGGLSSDSLIAALVEHLRSLLLVRACGPGTDLIDVGGQSSTELEEQAELFDTIALSQDIAILEELRRTMRQTQAGRALLDATLVRLALAEQFVAIADVLDGSARSATRHGGSSTSSVAAPLRAEQKKNIEPARAAVSSSSPVPPRITPGTVDDDDDLPRPGKVWDNSGPSLSELLKQQEQQCDPAVASAESSDDTSVATIKPDADVDNVIDVDPTDFAAVMKRLREAIHRHSPGIDGFLVHGEFRGVRDGVAIIRYTSAHGVAATMLDRNGKKDVIQRELSGVLNESVGVRFEVAEEPRRDGDSGDAASDDASTAGPRASRSSSLGATPALVDRAPAAPPSIRITPELREEIRSKEPLVRALMDTLGAEIVKVE